MAYPLSMYPPYSCFLVWLLLATLTIEVTQSDCVKSETDCPVSSPKSQVEEAGDDETSDARAYRPLLTWHILFQCTLLTVAFWSGCC